jgi:signal transduction histidine kinase
MHFGLGLSLTRGAVEAMGGTICATSRKGGAFRIRIEIPAGRAEPVR